MGVNSSVPGSHARARSVRGASSGTWRTPTSRGLQPGPAEASSLVRGAGSGEQGRLHWEVVHGVQPWPIAERGGDEGALKGGAFGMREGASCRSGYTRGG